ncbi:unnamed protein product [Prorocentrum cordatum]|uniref:UBC core domain-containing protein n=1 Tax=Prorocentrum cordatum TaxID=2364126 RepID=A0ABN9SBF3_9DINO|nr:unnamed protein product [Polarella glacialis]
MSGGERAEDEAMSEHRSQAALCQEVETELRELCQECRKKFPIIKEYTERAILKIRCHHEQVEKAARASTAPGAQAAAAPEFPLDEVLRAILMACETFQCKIVLLSLSCLQRLIHRRVLKDETVAIVINLMKEQAAHGDESVQLKVLQTIMATPAHMTLLNELVVEQLMQLLHVLHNSSAPSVHHTACAGLRQLVEFMSDRAAAALAEASAQAEAPKLDGIKPVIRARATALPSVSPSQPPPSLPPAVRMFVIFVQDLCVMADYDPSSFSMRYAVDAGERLRSASREGYWLATVKFPRPLCLELLGVCVASHPAIFASSPECFQLLRHNICAALLKNLQSCYDFAILIRSVHLLQQITRAPGVAALLMHEVQIFLHLMLDLTSAERSPWQRATSLEFLKSVCEDPAMLTLLYEHGNSGSADAERERRSSAPGAPSGSPHVGSGPRTFLELVNSLSKLIHQVCFSAGTDSGSLLQSAPAAASALPPGGPQRAQSGDVGRGLLTGNFPGLLSLGTGGAGSGTRDMLGGAGAPAADGAARPLGKDGGAGAGAAGSSDQRRRRGGKLLLMMSDTEPPAVPPALLVSLVVESVLSIVSTLYRLLLDAVPPDAPVQDAGVPVTPLGALRAALPCPSGEAGGDAPTEAPSRHSTPLSGVLTFEQQQVQAMLGDSWASLLSALSLLMHGIMDEQCLQQALRCMQTLLFCCSRLALDQARDACLLQLSRYALPGPGHEAEAEAAAAGCMVGGGLTVKNVLCFKALLHFCCLFGRLLGSAGWSIVLHAFNGLERALGKVPRAQSELTVLRQALDALFETTAVLDREALGDIIEAMGQTMKGTSDGQPGQSGPKGGPPADGDEGAVVLERLVELCSFNLGRLVQIWAHVLRVISDVCMSEVSVVEPLQCWLERAGGPGPGGGLPHIQSLAAAAGALRCPRGRLAPPMASFASKRLAQERAAFKKDHPFGFYAKYAPNEDGKGQNVFKWNCGIPGRAKGPWEGAAYALTMEFTEDYPSKPPKCKFMQINGKPLFHPNIYPSGTVCLSILNEDEDWKPAITIRQILLGIQDLLDNPNAASPAQEEPYRMFSTDKAEYLRRVKLQVAEVAAMQAK